jgi:glutathione synthase/RimK-type ligase-like ATP-grasp enzyme
MTRHISTRSNDGQIVVISEPSDAHIPFVERFLPKPFIVIDPVSIVAGNNITHSLNKQGDLETIYRGQPLHNVTAVWYRKPRHIEAKDIPVEPAWQAYCHTAIQEFTHTLHVQFPRALWVSDYYAITKATIKPLQVSLASKLGFNVPETIFTSDKTAAGAFVSSHPASIIKPLSQRLPPYKAFFARKVHPGEKIDYSGLHLAPTIFQEAIDAAFDLRVTVVGNKVFAAAISVSGLGKKDAKIRDWRIGHFRGKLTIMPYKLKVDIKKKCIAHVKKLGLTFGAIDLVVDKKGDTWFLENNPNGQWAFVEEATGQPIGKAIADLLMAGSSA